MLKERSQNIVVYEKRGEDDTPNKSDDTPSESVFRKKGKKKRERRKV